MAKKVSYNVKANAGATDFNLVNRYKDFEVYFNGNSLAAIRLKPKQGQRFKVTIEKVGK